MTLMNILLNFVNFVSFVVKKSFETPKIFYRM
jgi:hypothetical protein